MLRGALLEQNVHVLLVALFLTDTCNYTHGADGTYTRRQTLVYKPKQGRKPAIMFVLATSGDSGLSAMLRGTRTEVTKLFPKRYPQWPSLDIAILHWSGHSRVH